MKAILIKSFSPGLADVLGDYPYFILHKLAEHGVGCVEAEKPADGGEVVTWNFTSRLTGGKLELARSPRGMFRPVLARFALVADINPYGGHAYFAAEPAPHWPAAGLHRFSLYLSNHQSTGAWIRLYLCAIDGVWPPGNVDPPLTPGT